MMIEDILNKLEQDPENPELLCDVGKNYKKMGQFENALKYFTNAIEKDRNHIPAYCGLINLYLDFGNYQQGFQVFNEALTRFKESNKSKATLFNALFANFLLHRLPDYTTPEKVQHNYEEYFFKMGEIFRNNGLYDAAAKVYEACYDLSSSNIRMILNLAECYTTLEKYSLAERVLLEGYNQYNTDTDILCQLAKVYFKAGYYEHCIEYCKKYLEINPENTYIQNLLAYSYIKEGSIISAINIYNQQIETSEKKLIPLKNLYILYKVVSNQERANDIYNTIKVNYPTALETLNVEFSHPAVELLNLIEI